MHITTGTNEVVYHLAVLIGYDRLQALEDTLLPPLSMVGILVPGGTFWNARSGLISHLCNYLKY